jgi:hypothetical protein
MGIYCVRGLTCETSQLNVLGLPFFIALVSLQVVLTTRKFTTDDVVVEGLVSVTKSDGLVVELVSVAKSDGRVGWCDQK